MTPADTLSCRRQTNPEDTANLALSLTVPTLDPLTDMAISGGGPARWAPVLTRRLIRKTVYTSYTRLVYRMAQLINKVDEEHKHRLATNGEI